MTYDQTEFDIRCEWGPPGVAVLAPVSDAIIIVDVMSFTSCVSVAVSRGAFVYPYRFRDKSALEFAKSVEGLLAGPRGSGGYSLSPASLIDLPKGTRLVLPSPNGSSLSLMTGQTPTFAGCLRNCAVVAKAAMSCGQRVSVIPAGERWPDDQTLRPSVEDLVGAGAIIDYLGGSRSPEAEIAVAAYHGIRKNLPGYLDQCSSGKELISKGFQEDIAVIAELNADIAAPFLSEGKYIAYDMQGN